MIWRARTYKRRPRSYRRQGNDALFSYPHNGKSFHLPPKANRKTERASISLYSNAPLSLLHHSTSPSHPACWRFFLEGCCRHRTNNYEIPGRVHVPNRCYFLPPTFAIVAGVIAGTDPGLTWQPNGTISTDHCRSMEVCSAARASRTVVYEAIRRGELVARKRGRRTVVLSDDFATWLKSLPTITPTSNQPRKQPGRRVGARRPGRKVRSMQTKTSKRPPVRHGLFDLPLFAWASARKPPLTTGG